MNAFEGHSAELEARELGACLREAARRDASVEHMVAEAERLRRAVAQTAQSRRPLGSAKQRVVWLLAAAAMVLVVGLGVRAQLSRSRPLAFEVLGPGRVSPSYVVTPDDASAVLKFTDGSSILAHRATRLRVSELRSDGATLMIERGKATVEVTHRERNTRWNIGAGPFAIVVTGTKFVVEWSPSAESFSVEMLEGRVEVDGPKFTAPATLRGGQRMTANAKEAVWAVTPLLDSSEPPQRTGSVERAEKAPSAANVPPNTAPKQPHSGVRAARPTSAAETATPSSVGSAMAPVPELRPSWSKLVAQGESQKVVAEAESSGVKSCMAQCSSADLRALADAARYSGRLDLAEASLRALRERFPAQAAVAAYLLGTVDEARGRNASALRWYEEYVAAVPSGGFSSEALAGRLRMLVATNGYTSARKAAQQYLELYPSGIGAKTARQILDRR